MYSDLAQTQRYDDTLTQKAQSFQDAQGDAAWLGQALRSQVNRLGTWLVNGGQWLQTLGTDKQVALRKLR